MGRFVAGALLIPVATLGASCSKDEAVVERVVSSSSDEVCLYWKGQLERFPACFDPRAVDGPRSYEVGQCVRVWRWDESLRVRKVREGSEGSCPSPPPEAVTTTSSEPSRTSSSPGGG